MVSWFHKQGKLLTSIHIVVVFLTFIPGIYYYPSYRMHIYCFNGLLQPGLMVPFSFDKCGVGFCFLCVQALIIRRNPAPCKSRGYVFLGEG